MSIYCRGVRGATTCQENTREAILEATRDLLEHLVAANGIEPEDVGSIFFTTSPDLNAEFPAQAAREMGWRDVPLLCGHEAGVPGSMTRCIRILLHWNTPKSQREIRHIYLRDAVKLRPDLAAAIEKE